MTMRLRYTLAILAVAIASLVPSSGAYAQYDSYQLSVAASATISEQPPSITISWPKDDSAKSYQIFRMDQETGTWILKKSLGTPLTWTDADVVPGQGYEYAITKSVVVNKATVKGYGYLYTGINLPPREFQGTVELIVDDTFASALSSELSRLNADLVADGWKVRRHDVKRTDSVQKVRSIIQGDYTADSTVRTVFLFGHVPVAYSGFINPDGHPNHLGAWPADVYYGDMTGTYTDDAIDSSIGIIPANANRPGDGKFDQSTPDGGVDLEVGRVDFWNMPSFAKSELELLRQYLNKDHAFRAGTLTAPKRALVSDNFGTYGEGFASDAWRNFPNFVGSANVLREGWFTTLDTASYLWAYGCGGGSFTSAGGIGSTTDFAKTDSKAIFTLMFGSYFGDWNVQDNFLRAPLTSSTTLTCAWGGRPHWYLHHMAMGNTIGFSTRLTQNNFSTYDPGYGAQFVHIALMGDPTLRMSYTHPSSDFTSISVTGAGPLANLPKITWSSSAPAEGYNVYRMHYWNEVYQKVNSLPITGGVLIDSTPYADSNYYVVRAVAKDGDTHGTFYVTGAPSHFVEFNPPAADVSMTAGSNEDLRIALDGSLANVTITRATSAFAKVSLFDLSGRELAVLDNDLHEPGMHRYEINLANRGMTAGVYFVRVLSSEGQRTLKFIYRN